MIKISNKEELRRLITRYVRGQASREEIYFLHQYYEHFEDQSNDLSNLSASERDKLKSEIFGAIDPLIENPHASRRPKLWIRRVAAVLIFLIVGAATLWLSPFYFHVEFTEEHTPEQVTRTITMTFRADEEQLHHYLPDGSYVLLEPGSQITYSPRFSNEIREVELEGVAFFDIKREVDRPFVVLANGVSTRVLGTAFRITSEQESDKFSISVTSGKVEVSDNSHQLAVLKKNDQMVFDRSTNAITKTILKDEQVAKLEPAMYIMDNITVGEALDVISKRWDCDFRVLNTELQRCEFTTSFLPSDNLEDIVTVISAVIGADFNIEGRVVTLTGNGCE